MHTRAFLHTGFEGASRVVEPVLHSIHDMDVTVTIGQWCGSSPKHDMAATVKAGVRPSTVTWMSRFGPGSQGPVSSPVVETQCPSRLAWGVH